MLILFLGLFLPAHASGAFTIEDENKVGREFHDKLAKHGYLDQNRKAADYLTRIGNLVLAHSRKAPFDFRFFIVKSSAVNAFATPGAVATPQRGRATLNTTTVFSMPRWPWSSPCSRTLAAAVSWTWAWPCTA